LAAREIVPRDERADDPSPVGMRRGEGRETTRERSGRWLDRSLADLVGVGVSAVKKGRLGYSQRVFRKPTSYADQATAKTLATRSLPLHRKSPRFGSERVYQVFHPKRVRFMMKVTSS
jgi:hypothetical protein